jgi:hypothetical protein
MTAPCRGGSARTATTSSCEEKTLEQREVFRLETVDHDQVLKYLGDSPEDREERSHTPETATAEASRRAVSHIREKTAE